MEGRGERGGLGWRVQAGATVFCVLWCVRLYCTVPVLYTVGAVF